MVEKFGIGQPVPRTEDPRLLTGGGNYLDDNAPANQARAYRAGNSQSFRALLGTIKIPFLGNAEIPGATVFARPSFRPSSPFMEHAKTLLRYSCALGTA